MIRAQCIVNRGQTILMVQHRVDGETWWCLLGEVDFLDEVLRWGDELSYPANKS